MAKKRLKFPVKLRSRKLWLSIVAALFPIFNEAFGWGLDQDVVIKVFTALMGFVVVEGVGDAASRLNH